MSEKISVNLGNVQKTLFLPLWGLAVETRKPHPMLVDPAAALILDRLDYNFTPLAQNLDELTRLAWDPRIQLLGAYYDYRDLHIGLRNLLMGTFADLLGIQYMIHLRLGTKAW